MVRLEQILNFYGIFGLLLVTYVQNTSSRAIEMYAKPQNMKL